jgi:spermidine synthase
MKALWVVFAISSLCAIERYQETLYSSWGQNFEVTQMVCQEKSDFWDLAIFENPIFGRVLAIDGMIQTTEKDEAIYHEMLVHPALMTLEKPISVLVIGGGDGGALREVLRHNDVERVVLVEIDVRVMELVKEYMPSLPKNAFEDPRVKVVIQDASVYMKESQEMFDAIICDSCDPMGASAALFTEIFYGDCKKRLKAGGILVNQNGVPFLQKKEYEDSLKNRKIHFKEATFYTVAVPTYAGGLMTIGWSSDVKYRVSLAALRKKRANIAGKMVYYTPAMHKASFALPSSLVGQGADLTDEIKPNKVKDMRPKIR